MSAAGTDTARVRLAIPEDVDAARVFGPADSLLRTAERLCACEASARGAAVSLAGPSGEVDMLARLLDRMIAAVRAGEALTVEDVEREAAALRREERARPIRGEEVVLSLRGKPVRAKTPGQRRYVEAVRSHAATFCIGPAGTGKTYLAMAMAVAALVRHDVGRIVLTRPAVEAGESLGFLPGTLEEKADPYVRPLYDALFDLMEVERARELLARGTVEIAPLAYMRGRTLNDAFVILDEAQNTTPEQMRMFLTRLGFNSTFVIAGDATQRDLSGARGGIEDAREVLGGVEGIAFVELERADVVRHSLVGRIVGAYEARDAARAERGRDAGCTDEKGGGRHGRSDIQR